MQYPTVHVMACGPALPLGREYGATVVDDHCVNRVWSGTAAVSPSRDCVPATTSRLVRLGSNSDTDRARAISFAEGVGPPVPRTPRHGPRDGIQPFAGGTPRGPLSYAAPRRPCGNRTHARGDARPASSCSVPSAVPTHSGPHGARDRAVGTPGNGVIAATTERPTASRRGPFCCVSGPATVRGDAAYEIGP